MRAWLLLALAGGAAALSLPSALARPGAAEPTRLFRASQPILELAAEGRRIAFASGTQRCARMHVMDEVSRKPTPLGRHAGLTCPPSGGARGGVRLAIAGARVAWIAHRGGNIEQNRELITAATPRPRARRLARARYYEELCREGSYLGGLAGDGTLLVYNAWSVTCDPADGRRTITRAVLRRIAPSGKATTIAAGPHLIEAKSLDAGRVAVVRSDGSVALLRVSDGSTMRVFLPLAVAKLGLRTEEAALHARVLLVRVFGEPRREGGRTDRLIAYDTESGLVTGTWTVPGARRLDVEGDLAVYQAGSQARVLRLSDGRSAALGRATAVAVEAHGIYVAAGRDLGFLAASDVAELLEDD